MACEFVNVSENADSIPNDIDKPYSTRESADSFVSHEITADDVPMAEDSTAMMRGGMTSAAADAAAGALADWGNERSARTNNAANITTTTKTGKMFFIEKRAPEEAIYIV